MQVNLGVMLKGWLWYGVMRAQVDLSVMLTVRVGRSKRRNSAGEPLCKAKGWLW